MKIIEYIKFSGKFEENLARINLIFVVIFLNIWDFIISRDLFNAMTIGILMFGPVVFLWFVGTVRAVAAVTLISLFEFTVMAVFVVEGFELSGVGTTLKSLFWLPYLLMAAVNGFWGLKIYSEHRDEKENRVKSK